MSDLNMKITNVKVKRFGTPKGGILGVASVVLNNMLVIHDIRIVQLRDKRILSFPAKKVLRYEDTGNGVKEYHTYEDIVHPATSELRRYMEDIIFSQFEKTKEDQLSEQSY